jgi:hypothetical protein
MRTMDTLNNTLNSSIRECDAHRSRMNYAILKLSSVLPLSIENFPLEDDDLMAYLDQFLFRFSKLQDSMAHRLCSPLYGLLEGTTETFPFIDILNRLEKYGALTSADTWQYFRFLRNNMTHDYPESLKKNVDNLNLIITHWPELEALYIGLKKASRRFKSL